MKGTKMTPHRRSAEDCDAYARLALGLCDVLTQFLAATLHTSGIAPFGGETRVANDNQPPELSMWPDDAMTTREVRHELCLKDRHVILLRRLCGFPEPARRNGRLFYSRREVERWVRSQPNQSDLTSVLPRRRVPNQSTRAITART